MFSCVGSSSSATSFTGRLLDLAAKRGPFTLGFEELPFSLQPPRVSESHNSRDTNARFGLLEYLAATGAELVATEALARVDLTPVQAARRGLAVWAAGDALVAALLDAAAIRDPARAAALLARLPVIPLLRRSIRRLVAPDRRQLPLL